MEEQRKESSYVQRVLTKLYTKNSIDSKRMVERVIVV